jgi:hypothetical protein
MKPYPIFHIPCSTDLAAFPQAALRQEICARKPRKSSISGRSTGLPYRAKACPTPEPTGLYGGHSGSHARCQLYRFVRDRGAGWKRTAGPGNHAAPPVSATAPRAPGASQNAARQRPGAGLRGSGCTSLQPNTLEPNTLRRLCRPTSSEDHGYMTWLLREGCIVENYGCTTLGRDDC